MRPYRQVGQVELAIQMREKDVAALVAAVGDVIGMADDDRPRPANHGGFLTRSGGIFNFAELELTIR